MNQNYNRIDILSKIAATAISAKKMICIIFVFLIFTELYSEIFVEEFYCRYDGINKENTKKFALAKLKQKLQFKIGSFYKFEFTEKTVEMNGELFDFSKYDIEVILPKIINYEILEDKFTENNCYLKVKVETNKDEIENMLKEIAQSENKYIELQEIKSNINEYLSELEKINSRINNSDNQKDQRIVKKYNQLVTLLDAEDWCIKGINALKTYYQYHYHRNDLKDGEFEQVINNAFSYFTTAINLNPNHIPSLNYIATIYSWKNNHNKALTYYDKIIQIKPNDLNAIMNIGIIYSKKGNFIKAKECYLKAIQVDSTYTKSYTNLGIYYLEIGEYEEAIDCFYKVLNYNENDGMSYFRIAVVYATRGDIQNSIKYHQKAANLNVYNSQHVLDEMNIPYSINSKEAINFFKKGKLCFESNDFINAKYYFEKSFSLEENSAKLYYYLSETYRSINFLKYINNEEIDSVLFKKAKTYTLKAAKLGSKKAMSRCKDNGIMWWDE